MEASYSEHFLLSAYRELPEQAKETLYSMAQYLQQEFGNKGMEDSSDGFEKDSLHFPSDVSNPAENASVGSSEPIEKIDLGECVGILLQCSEVLDLAISEYPEPMSVKLIDTVQAAIKQTAFRLNYALDDGEKHPDTDFI